LSCHSLERTFKVKRQYHTPQNQADCSVVF
jgi:hypothetical protein